MDKELEHLLNIELSDDDSFDSPISNQDSGNKINLEKEEENILSKSQTQIQIENINETNKEFLSDIKNINQEKERNFKKILDESSLLESRAISGQIKTVFQEMNEFEEINRKIRIFYEEKPDEMEFAKDNVDSTSIVSINTTLNSNDQKNLTIGNKIQTTTFTVRDYYQVTRQQMVRQGNFQLDLKNSITFAFGQNKYISISDISGNIIFFDLINKSIELIKRKGKDVLLATALEFSKSLSFIYVGYKNGEIAIYDVHSLMLIQSFENLFQKEIQQIICYQGNDFLVQDSGVNLYNFKHSSQFLIYHSFTPQNINFTEAKQIISIDTCELQDYSWSKQTLFFAIICLDGVKVNFYELFPNKKSHLVISRDQNRKLIAAYFNKKVYYEKQKIYVQLLLDQEICIQEIFQEEGIFQTQKLLNAKFNLDDPFLSQWLNDNTIFVLPCTFKTIILYNFPFIVQTDNLKTKNQDFSFLEKIENLEEIHFEISETFKKYNEIYKILKIDVDFKRIAILENKGKIMEVKLGNWQDFFDNEFEKSFFKSFLEKFWEVYEGRFTFFNDFIFEKIRRQKIMGLYLNDKISILADRNFSLLEQYLQNILLTYLKMENYNFIYSNLKELFQKNDKLFFYHRTLEIMVQNNKIKKMPLEYVLEVSQKYYDEGKKFLIRQLILNLVFENEQLDIMMDFCLEHKLFISLVSLCMNAKPPQFGRLINILVNKVQTSEKKRKISQPKVVLEPFANIYSSFNQDFTVEEITLWFFYEYLHKNIFGRQIEQEYFEMFFQTFFVIFFQSGMTPKIVGFNVKSFSDIAIIFFSIENYNYLLSNHHFYNLDTIELFMISYHESSSQFKTENQVDFLNMLILLLFDQVDQKKQINNPNDFFLKLCTLLRENEEFAFSSFLSLFQKALIKYLPNLLQGDLILNTLVEIFAYFDQIHLPLLEAISEGFIQISDYTRAFECLGLYYNKQLKDFLFEFVQKHLIDKNFLKHFLSHIHFFFIYSTKRTLNLFKNYKEDFPFDLIDEQIKSFPSIRMDFFEFICLEKPKFLDNEIFLERLFEMYVVNDREASLLEFLQIHFDKINKTKALELLKQTDFFEALAFFYDKVNNQLESFRYYIILYQQSHSIDPEHQKTKNFLNTSLQLLNNEQFIIQIIFESFLDGKENDNSKKNKVSIEFQKNVPIRSQSLTQRNSLLINKKLSNETKLMNLPKFSFNFQFLMRICTNKDHSPCQKLKGLIIYKLLLFSKDIIILDKILQDPDISKELHQQVLKELTFSTKFMDSSERIFVKDFLYKINNLLGKGFGFKFKCQVCKRIDISNYDRTNLSIIKPFCKHCYHFYCATTIIKLLKKYKPEIYENYNEKNIYKTCLICSKIHLLFRIRGQQKQELDSISQGIATVINTLGNALQPVKTVSSGLKGYFDQIITFGAIENENDIKQNNLSNSQEENKKQQQTVESWLIEQDLEEKKQRFQKSLIFKNNIPNFVDFEKEQLILINYNGKQIQKGKRQ